MSTRTQLTAVFVCASSIPGISLAADPIGIDAITWLSYIGIGICFVGSATCSGLTLGLFSLSRMKLEVLAEQGDHDAQRVLKLRKDANFLLSTLLWSNVLINVGLTLIADALMTAMNAFLFSVIGITLLGEILPQGYFARNALRMGALLTPVVRFLEVALFPVAKPTGLLLDALVGEEARVYFREEGIQIMLEKHIEATESDISSVEGRGALNFLSMDDVPISREGELLDSATIISLPSELDLPIFPDYQLTLEDPFIGRLHGSDKKWFVLTDESGEPLLMLDANALLRTAFRTGEPVSPYPFCHRPIIARVSDVTLGEVLGRLQVDAEHPDDDVIDQDVILYWTGDEKRIITGSDLLGRLLRGIVRANDGVTKPRIEGGEEPVL